MEPTAMSDPRAIGFFDSGVGGLTVLREVIRRLPDESTIYIGDNARAPYGPRSDDEVRRFSTQCLDELAARDVKAIVVACNTSSAVALPQLRLRYDVPLLGVVRPGATAAALATRNRRVGVIATIATVRSRAYFQAIKEEDPFVEVIEHATPDLVPLVEAGRLDGPLVEDVVRNSLEPLTSGGHQIDTLLLGCTHYPLLAPVIRAAVGADVAVIDSASATASALAGLLEIHSLAAPAGSTPTHVQLTTGDVEAFHRVAGALFGESLGRAGSVEIAGAATGAVSAAGATPAAVPVGE
jgi:glutamate racemase